jgi:hypothetical protein
MLTRPLDALARIEGPGPPAFPLKLPPISSKSTPRARSTRCEKGATETVILAKKKEMETMKVMYSNPLINAAMTFIEPFPVGLDR